MKNAGKPSITTVLSDRQNMTF